MTVTIETTDFGSVCPNCPHDLVDHLFANTDPKEGGEVHCTECDCVQRWQLREASKEMNTSPNS
jgi:hypothetical protein